MVNYPTLSAPWRRGRSKEDIGPGGGRGRGSCGISLAVQAGPAAHRGEGPGPVPGSPDAGEVAAAPRVGNPLVVRGDAAVAWEALAVPVPPVHEVFQPAPVERAEHGAVDAVGVPGPQELAVAGADRGGTPEEAVPRRGVALAIDGRGA